MPKKRKEPIYVLQVFSQDGSYRGLRQGTHERAAREAAKLVNRDTGQRVVLWLSEYGTLADPFATQVEDYPAP